VWGEVRIFDRHKPAEGTTSMEAIRSLERRLSDVVYRRLVVDQQSTQGPGAPRNVSVVQGPRGRQGPNGHKMAPTSEHFGGTVR
jgi:hypothetical protein